MTAQAGDLVRLFPNIESLDARRWTQSSSPEEPEDAVGHRSRFEQLTALTRLTTLIAHRRAGWGDFSTQVPGYTYFRNIFVLLTFHAP